MNSLVSALSLPSKAIIYFEPILREFVRRMGGAALSAIQDIYKRMLPYFLANDATDKSPKSRFGSRALRHPSLGLNQLALYRLSIPYRMFFQLFPQFKQIPAMLPPIPPHPLKFHRIAYCKIEMIDLSKEFEELSAMGVVSQMEDEGSQPSTNRGRNSTPTQSVVENKSLKNPIPATPTPDKRTLSSMEKHIDRIRRSTKK